MFDSDTSYSTINTVKCYIATIVPTPSYPSFQKHPLVEKYMTGIFNLRSPKPKLSNAWGVYILL